MPRLDRFLDDARRRVAAGAYAVHGPTLHPNGSLKAAVARAGAGAIVAELKPASPSEGRLLQRPVAAVLADFKAGGADALSVLTDADHFGGSPTLLRETHGAGLPTLMKDFIVDKAQLDCAAHAGASAVLLIERALGAQRREALVAAAHARGLEVLLEVFDGADWQAARASAADLVGVNSRDLETLQVDPARAAILLGQVAHERPGAALALSGISRRRQVRAALAAGAAGVLVGTALARAPDPVLLLRSLRRPLAKVCGLRTSDELRVAAAAGADLVGLVVGSPGSPRDLPVEGARDLAHVARRLGLRSVLVTRHRDLGAVRAWCEDVRPDFLQLHAPASEDWIRALAPVQVLVVFGPGPGTDLPAGGAGIVLDGTAEGGQGRAHDWSRARLSVDGASGRLAFIAGGLDATTAARALQESGAAGADASSGLESAPGRKDPAKVAAFVQAVHAA
jgi:indole-3-glycerol phosphate synthase/phosphoribosylanthranilate isomerase